MTNVIDFLTASSDFMAADRPDVYSSPAVAFSDLSETMTRMREYEGSATTSFTSYMLIKQTDPEGFEEWDLVRKLATVATDYDEGETMVYAHTKSSGALKIGLDLPDVLDFGTTG